ncbi:MAG: hypothetical protein KatS3mg091_357 [Patescibacteria group bacterium]|nr:MAG: hypothetical protein KatS3mg091_357 [Patescibacteria group bacterium]
MFAINYQQEKLKKYILTLFLSIFALAEGLILSHLNLYPLSKTLIINNSWLIISALLIWIAFMICVLILDFGLKKNKQLSFGLAAALFSTPFLIKTRSITLSAILFILFYYLLNIINRQLKNRASNYVKINIIETVSPLLNLSFNILLALITLIIFYQTNLYTAERNLVTEDSLKTILQPLRPVINQQFNQILNNTIEKDLQQRLDIQDRKQASKLLLEETIETLLEGQIRQNYGTNKLVIPLEKISLSETGDIDIYPAIEYIISEIIQRLNNLSVKYRLIISLITSLIVYFTIAIITKIIYYFALPIVYIVFKLLLQLKIIKIKLIKVDKEIISL